MEESMLNAFGKEQEEMNVKELIEKLSTLNPDVMVVVSGYEGGVDELLFVTTEVVELNVNSTWYYGRHEIDNAYSKGGDIPNTHKLAVHLK